MSQSLSTRIGAIDWKAIAQRLDEEGFVTTGMLLAEDHCMALTEVYDDDSRFRSRVNMARHNFGMGEYKYFDYPLPKIVQTLRTAFYPKLANIANHWAQLLGGEDRFPPTLPAYLRRCHDTGQTRPTPLLLKYGASGYNCLHQDLYGDLVFPFQLTILLSTPWRDFEGGEFLLAEQRPRMQSRAHVVPLAQGEAVIFPVRHRPLHGRRRYYRAAMRHGVSTIRSSSRLTLGIIFHDAH